MCLPSLPLPDHVMLRQGVGCGWAASWHHALVLATNTTTVSRLAVGVTCDQAKLASSPGFGPGSVIFGK